MAERAEALPRSPEEWHAIFERLVENSAVAIAVVRAGHFLYVNPGFCQMFGYSREELISRLSISDLVDEQYRSIVLENLSKPKVGGIDKIDHVFRAKRKDGTQIRVALRGTYTELAGEATLVAGFVDVQDRPLRAKSASPTGKRNGKAATKPKKSGAH